MHMVFQQKVSSLGVLETIKDMKEEIKKQTYN